MINSEITTRVADTGIRKYEPVLGDTLVLWWNRGHHEWKREIREKLSTNNIFW